MAKMYREALKLKQIHISLLRMILERPRTSKELIDLFAANFPNDYSTSSPAPAEAFNDPKIFSILRQMEGKKHALITKDPSRRWQLTANGREALRQEALLSFNRTVRTISDTFFKSYKVHDTLQPGSMVLEVLPFDFPSFPPSSAIICLETHHNVISKHYLIDLPPNPTGTEEELYNRLKTFEPAQKRLASLVPDVTVIFGGLHGSTIRLQNDSNEGQAVKDNSMDEIVSLFLFGLSPNPSTLLAELFRVLKPGGSYKLMEYIAEESLFQFIIEDLTQQGLDTFPPTHQCLLEASRDLTIDFIKTAIEKSTFEIEEILPIANLPVFRLKKPV